MRNRLTQTLSRTAHLAIAAGLLVAALLPFVSWLLWSFGLPVASLFSGEGLRFLAIHSLPNTFHRTLSVLLLVLSAVGLWQFVLSYPALHKIRRRAAWSGGAAGLLLLSTLVLSALLPDSPLLSINGTLQSSAFSLALVPYTATCAAVAALVYGFTVGAVSSLASLVQALLHGPRRYAALALLYVVWRFNFICLQYMAGVFSHPLS